MADLPTEVLDLIVSQVALETRWEPKEKAFKKDLGTLRSLRLANRRLLQVASAYLFEDVTLYFTEASHTKMMAISQHPGYRMCVRTVGISPKAIFGQFLDRDSFGQWLHKARPLVMSADYSEGYIRMPQYMAFLLKKGLAIDFHYAEYVSLYRKQEQLFGKAGSLLKTAISCFPRLEEVSSSVRTPPTTYSVPSFDDASVSDIWQDSACLYKFDLEHAVMILTAVSQGRSLARTQLDIGHFFYKLDTLIMDLQDSVARGQIQKLVADSKKIELSIQTLDFPRLQQALSTGKCKDFLGLMKSLESLSCWAYELHGSPFAYPSISDIFGDNTWQQLRRLEVGGVCTYASDLAKILKRHRSTLQKLVLLDILLSRGSWQDVFVEVRGGAIQVLKVHHLGCGDDPELFLEDTVIQHLDPIKSSHPLHAFLFQGASWKPWLDQFLEYPDPDSDSDSDSEPGSNSGSDLGSNAGSDSGSDLVSIAGSDSDSNPNLASDPELFNSEDIDME